MSDTKRSTKFGEVRVVERDTAYLGKIIPSIFLIAEISIEDAHGLCGFVGEISVNVGDIAVARRLQTVLDDTLQQQQAINGVDRVADNVRAITRQRDRLEAALRKAKPLLEEVMCWHADVKSPDYNGCEVDPCAWCEQADAVLAELDEERK